MSTTRHKSKVRGRSQSSPDPLLSILDSSKNEGIGTVITEVLRLCESEEVPASLFHFFRGVNRLLGSDLHGAATDLDACLRQDDMTDLVSEADLKSLSSLVRIGMHDFKGALKLAGDVARLVPNSPLPYVLKATVFAEMGDFKTALQEAGQASALLNSDASAANEIRKRPPASGSLSAFAKGIANSLAHPSLTCLQGELHIALGQQGEAYREFRSVVHTGQLDPYVLELAAKGMVRLGRMDEALRIADRLEQIHPEGSGHHVIRGLTKLELADRSAMDDIEKAILLDPNRMDLSVTKLQVLLGERDQTGVFKTLGRLLSMNTRHPQLLLLRGSASLDAGDFVGALKDFEAAHEVISESPLPQFAMAVALSAMGQGKDAMEALKRGLLIDTNSFLSQFAKGKVDFNLRRGDCGVSSLEAAVQTDSSAGEGWYALGLAYKATGRIADALSSLSQAGQRGCWKAYDVIRELNRSNLDWKEGQNGKPVVWKATLKEAAQEVLAAYEEDQKVAPNLRRFANLKDASDCFFETHIFPKHPSLTKRGFYDNVHKAKG